MTTAKNAGNDFVKKETMLIIAFIAVVAGFLGGVIFSAYKSGPGETVQTEAPAPPPAGGPQMPAAAADKILNLEGAVAADPANYVAWVELGHSYFDTDQFQKAIAAYRKSLELRPDNPDVLTDLGVMYRRTGQPTEAIGAFDQAIKLDPAHEQARFNKGVVLFYDLQDSQQALQVWEELLKINPAAAAPNGIPLRDVVENVRRDLNK